MVIHYKWCCANLQEIYVLDLLIGIVHTYYALQEEILAFHLPLDDSRKILDSSTNNKICHYNPSAAYVHWKTPTFDSCSQPQCKLKVSLLSTKALVSKDSYIHDTSASPSFISNPNPYKPPTELNKLSDIDNCQVFWVTWLKLVLLLPTVEIIAPGKPRQEVSSDLPLLQSSDSFFVLAPVLSLGPETAPLLSQGELLDAKNCDDVSIRLPKAAGAPCPGKNDDGKSPVNLVGLTSASNAALQSPVSTIKGLTSTIQLLKTYDYNVTQTRPGYHTLHMCCPTLPSKEGLECLCPL